MLSSLCECNNLTTLETSVVISIKNMDSTISKNEHPEDKSSRNQCFSYLEDRFHAAFVALKASTPCYGELKIKQHVSDHLDSYCVCDLQDNNVALLVVM